MKSKLVLLIVIAFSLAACNGSTKKAESGEGTASDSTLIAPEAGDRVMYQCPMHPEEISDKQGQCSKCGMDLEKITIRGNDTIRG
jgi:hypothetical protein